MVRCLWSDSHAVGEPEVTYFVGDMELGRKQWILIDELGLKLFLMIRKQVRVLAPIKPLWCPA